MNVITLKLSGGEHHLYNDKLCQKFMNIGYITPIKDKRDKYIEQYMAMHYFIRADEHFYYYLQKDILADSYQDRNDYTKTLQRAYYMLHFHATYITTTSHHRKNGRRNTKFMFKHRQTSKDQGNEKGQKRYLEHMGGSLIIYVLN